MTTYDQPTQLQLTDENLALMANRLQWREAEREWLHAERALREFEERVLRRPNELPAEPSKTGETLRLRWDEARARVTKLDLAYAAAWEFMGDDADPALHKEPLEFEYVKLAQRSYK